MTTYETALAHVGRLTVAAEFEAMRARAADLEKQNEALAARVAELDRMLMADDDLCNKQALRIAKLEGDMAQDAARWKMLRKRLDERMTPTRSSWDIVETSPMYGDSRRVWDWAIQIDDAIAAEKP